MTPQVTSPPGTVVGTIQQEWTLIYPQFVIKDEAGNPVLRIEGPLCPISCCGDVDFKVKSVQTGTEVRVDTIL